MLRQTVGCLDVPEHKSEHKEIMSPKNVTKERRTVRRH